jgi:hypothetical protein
MRQVLRTLATLYHYNSQPILRTKMWFDASITSEERKKALVF